MGQRLPSLERDVQASILDFLAVERIFAIRLNTTGGRRIEGRFIPASHSGGAGVSDILAFPEVDTPGECSECEASLVGQEIIPLWIECKSLSGIQSAVQLTFQETVEAHNHAYLLARSIDDVRGWLKKNRRPWQ